jgi:uncharacterized cupredoxin-like copper-binding protein
MKTHHRATPWLFVLVVMLAGGCAATDYIADSPARIKAADWGKMKNVTVVLKEYAFHPSNLTFTADTPYVLEIKNEGTEKHYFSAEAFFKAIATRKVQSNTDGEIKAPYFSALEVYPGGALYLYFIPVKKGSYNLHCTIAGHEAMGMHGTIVIE